MTQLVGIARLAASAPSLLAKRRVEYFELASRSLLNRCSSENVPFDWTINPYRGCEFGCQYCYARYTHEFLELRDPLLFERRIYAKHFDAAAFRRELGRTRRGEIAALGTATDPYQPAERRYRITRGILETLAATGALRVGLITKSDLVMRDVELLARVAERHALRVDVTITTLDARMARALEPMAPTPARRLEAVRALASAGIRTGVNCCPVMPGFNDSEAQIGAVCEAAAKAGACSFHASALFLRSPTREHFLKFVERRDPKLGQRYKRMFPAHSDLRHPDPEAIAARVEAVRARCGLTERGWFEPLKEGWPPEAQMSLFDVPADGIAGVPAPC